MAVKNDIRFRQDCISSLIVAREQTGTFANVIPSHISFHLRNYTRMAHEGAITRVG